jgi:hypothetical protein
VKWDLCAVAAPPEEATMKAIQSRTHTSERETMIVDVATRIAALFAQLPMLSGFSVQDRATLTADRNAASLVEDLCIADVAVHVWPGLQATPLVYGEIVQAMLELLEEHPGAHHLLRGCTFARTFH